MIITEDVAEVEGGQAWASHRPESDCPYAPFHELWDAWHRGFYTAMEFEADINQRKG
jgi:hypothetical protein